jgi:hypothetical protein
MSLRRLAQALLAPVLAFAVAGAVAGDGAAAESLNAEYAVSIMGFPVGRAQLQAEIHDRHYTVVFSGRVSGLARLFSSARTRAQATGTIGDDRPLAEDYTHIWIEDDDTETVAMHFRGRGVAEIDLEPPLKRPERYIPLTAQHKADALDLVSGFLWPAPAGAAPETCDRTLPLIDGKRRFDIEFAFSRMESFAVGNGLRQRRAVVCTITYRPIAGQRIDKKTDGFLTQGDDMEVWLTATGNGLVVPVKVQLASKVGRVVLEATALQTN